jgi:hypothetical protein
VAQSPILSLMREENNDVEIVVLQGGVIRGIFRNGAFRPQGTLNSQAAAFAAFQLLQELTAPVARNVGGFGGYDHVDGGSA